jgi:hypothetical protein
MFGQFFGNIICDLEISWKYLGNILEISSVTAPYSQLACDPGR